MYGFVGLSLYMFIKKHPNESKNMFLHANSLVKYMPIDKGTSELLTPFMDFTSIHEKMSNISPLGASQNITPQFKRMLNSEMFNRVDKQKDVLVRKNMLPLNSSGNVDIVRLC